MPGMAPIVEGRGVTGSALEFLLTPGFSGYLPQVLSVIVSTPCRIKSCIIRSVLCKRQVRVVEFCMKAAKLSVDELLRLACVYAEQDRQGFLGACSHMLDDPAAVAAKHYLGQLREYRKKRWGKTELEDRLEKGAERKMNDVLEDFEP